MIKNIYPLHIFKYIKKFYALKYLVHKNNFLKFSFKTHKISSKKAYNFLKLAFKSLTKNNISFLFLKFNLIFKLLKRIPIPKVWSIKIVWYTTKGLLFLGIKKYKVNPLKQIRKTWMFWDQTKLKYLPFKSQSNKIKGCRLPLHILTMYNLKKNLLKKVNNSLPLINYNKFLFNYIQKLYFLIQLGIKKKKRFFKNYSSKAFTNKKQVKALLEKKKRSYAILKLNVSFSNFSFMLTSLTGQILRSINGGMDFKLTKRTRMTSRAVGKVMVAFLKIINESRRIHQRGIRYIKVEFIGPSKRFRQKLFKMFHRSCRKFKFRIVCQAEAFNRSYNGCRLSRKKR